MNAQVITASLPDTTVKQIVVLLQQITAEFPFMMNLTPEERQSTQSVSDGRSPYVQKVLEFAQHHHAKIGITPADLAELEQVAGLFEDLMLIFNLVDVLRNGLRDTAMHVGANYYRLSRVYHGQIKLASAKGKPGMETMINSLDKLFENQGKAKPAEEVEVIDAGAVILPAADIKAAA